jgi:chorismate dehydratase
MRTRKLRVGTVPYLVGRPLDCGLESAAGIELVRKVPSDLVTALRAGMLDVALVSSIELFRRPGYRYLDGLAVSGAGFVGSVQVFLRRPIREVTSVALDPASRTAATLVQILLRPPVRFVDVLPGTDPKEAPTDAWLAIGDPALRQTLAANAPPAFNPAAAWFERTQLPFIFAAWIVRPGVVLEPSHLAAFGEARARGVAQIEELATRASREWKLPVQACRTYLTQECRFEPGPDFERALYRFRDEAAAIGMCEKSLSPIAIAGATQNVS